MVLRFATRRGRSCHRSIQRRRSTFETLEPRLLPAGNVIASVLGGDLVITGDNAGNGVLISQLNARTYKVAGIEWDGRATTVNGRSEVILTGVRSNLIVDLRSGRDAVAITNQTLTPTQISAPSASLFQGVASVRISQDLIVSGDAADDIVVLGAVLVGRNATLQGGAGQDLLFVAHATIQSQLRVTGNAGDDVITVSNSVVGTQVTLSDTEGQNQVFVSRIVAAFADLTSGAGNDVLKVSRSTFSLLRMETAAGSDQIVLERLLLQSLSVNMGSGNDSFRGFEVTVLGNASVLSGEGADTIELGTLAAGGLNEVRGNLTIDAGGGNDRVTLASVVVDQNLSVVGGRGSDQVRLTNTEGFRATIDLGEDDDSLTMSGLVVDQLFARLGTGDDTLSIGNSRVNRLVLDGGGGARDALEESLGNSFRRREVFNFERVTRRS